MQELLYYKIIQKSQNKKKQLKNKNSYLFNSFYRKIYKLYNKTKKNKVL